MATYFIVADVHGFYKAMVTALNKAGFDANNKDHIFVSLGDLLDRGKEPIKCLEFVNSLPKDRKILIRGNHEGLMEKAIKCKYFHSYDYHNRTYETAQLVTGLSEQAFEDDEILSAMEKNELWNTYINSCIDYYEDDKHIFVHGWIPIEKDWRNGDWKDARWSNGMKEWLLGNRVEGKTIYCGHYHASWGHCNIHGDGKEFLDLVETFYVDENGKEHPYVRFDPFEDEGICALDACTALSRFVNCVKLEDMRKPYEDE